jgi:hypothetical protein
VLKRCSVGLFALSRPVISLDGLGALVLDRLKVSVCTRYLLRHFHRN